MSLMSSNSFTTKSGADITEKTGRLSVSIIWSKESCFYFFYMRLETEFYKNYSTLIFNKTFS